MKRYSICILLVILALSLSACGRNKTPMNTESSSIPSNTTSAIPSMDPTILDPTILDPTILDPTMHTNIPDPSVDTSMPDMTSQTETKTSAK